MTKKTSGIEKVPQILRRPIFTDRLVWFGIAAALFWVLVIWLLAG